MTNNFQQLSNYYGSSSGSQPETGKKVKNYIYHYADMIGHGNFAKVYKGINIQTNQTVAVKLVSLDQLKSKHLEALVFEEIRILQQFSHPNILRFIEAMLSERNCYIVTELCREGSLDDRIKTKVPFSQEELGRIIVDIWKGLKYMKEKGVAHRDLKPANIFISNGHMKIADFGLAKFFTERFHDLDIGSPQYMSPEGMILNCYSEKTDIWSFGIILYELLHGQTPYIFCKNEQQLKYFVSRPLPENRWRKDVNPLLRRFIDRLLEVDQYKRPNVYQLANQPYLKALLEKQEGSYSPERLNSSSWQGYAQSNIGSSGNIRVSDISSQYQGSTLAPTWRPVGMKLQGSTSPKSKSMNNKFSLNNSSSPLKSTFLDNSVFVPPNTVKHQEQTKETHKYSFNKKDGIKEIPLKIQNNIGGYPRPASNESPSKHVNYTMGEPVSPELMHYIRNSNQQFVMNPVHAVTHQRQVSSTTLETNQSEDDRRSPNNRAYQVKRYN